MLMDYAYTCPNYILRYYESDTQLYIDSDVAYLVLPNARSRGAEYFNLSKKLTNMSIPPLPKTNDPILTEYQTLKYVMSPAAEAEVGNVHNNGKAVISIRVALDEMGHLQGPTPLKKDNNTAEDFVNNTIHKKRSKAFDMRFHWMIDCIKQK